MRFITITLLFSLLFSFYSCSNNSKAYTKIVGEWNCTSWIAENSTQDKCDNNAYFKFNEDRTYSSKLGGVEDFGTYKIDRDKLLAQPDGKMVIGVKIITLDETSMTFLMNNAGVKETLKLAKK